MTAAATAAGLFEVELPDEPYPGLRPFERDEWPIFFGREPMIRDVITRLLDRKLVVVHGDSGCGKSSLIRAGVLVQLEQQHERGSQRWRTCAMLPREAPLQNLAQALAKLDTAETDRSRIRQIRRCLNAGHDAPAALAKQLRRGEDDHICILIDQFEELFSFAQKHSRDQAQLFVDMLVGLQQDPPPGFYAILTMRSEFLGVCARFQGLAEAVNQTQYLLPQMERSALMRAIQEPATLYGGEVTRDLAERLTADATGDQDQLPLIQHGLMRLWRRKADPPTTRHLGLAEAGVPFRQDNVLSDAPVPFRHETGSEEPVHRPAHQGDDVAPASFLYGRGPAWRLGLEDYPGGGLGTLLSDHADEVMAAAARDRGQEKIVEHLFRALTDINAEGSAVRRPQSFAELVAVTGSDQETLKEMIDSFWADGVSFLRVYGDVLSDPGTLIDISHEALIRCWRKLADEADGWLQREFRDGLMWKSLRLQAGKGDTLSVAATTDRENWLQTLPSTNWCERYGGGWADVEDLMEASREDRARAQRRELQAQVGDSLFRAEQGRRQQDRGFPVTAMQLALAGLPDEPAGTANRPWVGETAGVLVEAMGAQRERFVLSGHEGEVYAAAFSPNGARIISSSTDRTVRIWAAANGAELLVLRGHEGWVGAAAFSPDGTRIVSGSDDQTVRVWDAARGAELLVLRGHQGAVYAARFSADGARIVSGSGDQTVRVWDAASGAELLVLRGHEDGVVAAAFSGDGARIVSASWDKTVRVWDAARGAELLVLRGHQGAVYAAGFSGDGARIVSGSDDQTVRVSDAVNGAELSVLRGHKGGVPAAGFSADGAHIVSGSTDCTVRVWNAASGAELMVLRGHEGQVYAAAFSPDGARIVSGSDDQTVRVWGAASNAELSVLRGHEGWVWAAGFSVDGARVVSGCGDQTVRLWDAANGAELLVLRGHEGGVSAAAFSADGARIVSGSNDRTVRVWDAASGAELLVLRGHEGWVPAAAFSPDGARIVSGSDDQTVRVWDAASGAELLVLREHEGGAYAAAFSPNGARIVSGSGDQTVRVWDSASGAELLVLRGHEDVVWAAAFSPDGARIISGSWDKTVRVWDSASGAELLGLRGHEDGVYAAAFSPDGGRIVSGSFDGTVRVWDAMSGAEVLVLRGHKGRVLSAAFSPDGARIVSGSADNTVRITWTGYTKKELIETARTRLPRELTDEERRRFHLVAE